MLVILSFGVTLVAFDRCEILRGVMDDLTEGFGAPTGSRSSAVTLT